jgi:hypothetical protein
MMSPAIASLPPPSSPYRGIEPFRYVDQAIFFARNDETRKLLRYVTIYRGVLLYSDSGTGKSSLINAGLVPAAISEGYTPERLRVQPRRGEEFIIERIPNSAGGHANYLPSSFADDASKAATVVLSVEAFNQRLRQSPPERRPLLIFDQFEEIITLFEEIPRGDMVKEALASQEAVLNTVIVLLRDQSLPVKLLFVFREDYLAKLNRLFVKCPELPDQYLRLTKLTTKSLHMIIRGPFESFPGHFGVELSEELARDLAAAIEERNEYGTLSLSEVQIVCLKLWESSDPEGLFRREGVQRLLEDYLSEALNRLDEDLRDPAVALLSRMVTAAGTRNIVSEYDLITKTSQDEGIPEDRLKDALLALVQDTRLVRRERRYNTHFYDIASEFLIPWISQRKLERRAEIERRKLEETERAKRRKLYWLVAACLIIALTVGLTAWEVISTRTEVAIREDKVKEANRAREAAERDRDAALARLGLANIKVPNVQGMDISQALHHLEKEGLKGIVSDLRINDVRRSLFQPNVVIIQYPPEGALVSRGTLVQLFFLAYDFR